MPYLHPAHRRLAEHTPTTAGELNFAITRLLLGYLDARGLRYDSLNDCLGALEGAKLEFYRRVVVPYEETKRAQHGEVYS